MTGSHFVRICSGEFDRGMDVFLLTHREKNSVIKTQRNLWLIVVKRLKMRLPGTLLDYMIPETSRLGIRSIPGKKAVQFEKLPQFTPELFVKVSPKNVMKQKSYHKGIQQLSSGRGRSALPELYDQ